MRPEPTPQPGIFPLRLLPAWLVVLASPAVVVGVGAFAVGALSAHPQEAWAALLVNWLFWMGLAQSLVVWAATFRLAGARWSAPVERLGEAGVAFLPLSLLIAVLLALGWRHIFPWTDADLGDRVLWLGINRLFLRTFLGLGLLTLLSFLYVRQARCSAARALACLKVAVPLTYVVVYTFLAFDFVMALHLFWSSSVLGLYFLAGALYAGMALLILLAAGLHRRFPRPAPLGPPQFQDLGNLMMAFGMVTAYLLFAQLLVVWYENLPHETDFLIARLHYPPWTFLSWLYLGGGLLGPFVLLTIRENKSRYRRLCVIAGLVLVMMGLERYLEVAPSLSAAPLFGVVTILVTLGFAGALALSLEWYFRRHAPYIFGPSASAAEEESP